MARILSIALLSFLAVQTVLADDTFNHIVWNQLLENHVIPIDKGSATVVDYQGFSADRDQLKGYLKSLSQINQLDFDQWSAGQQLAFLINAYNAWTVELILGKWPDIDSIKDLGGFFSSPWRIVFIPLLGEKRSLDNIEHDLIRGSGRYQDPRIHFAVNCASIGCPALRGEAYTGARIEQQLDQQTRLFLSDRKRNYWEGDTLKLSAIFKWYREDFEKGWMGYLSVDQFLADYLEALSLPPSLAMAVKTNSADIEYLDYDWRLNAKQ